MSSPTRTGLATSPGWPTPPDPAGGPAPCASPTRSRAARARRGLLCFSDEEPGTQGPRRVSQAEIREAFADGWDVEEIRAARYEVRPDRTDRLYSEGGPKARCSVSRRE